MILDFSAQSITEILQQDFAETWQKEIKQFLEIWMDDKETLEVKTSGSTGKPKIYNYPKSAFIQSAKITGEFLQLEKGDSALLCLPTNYIAGKMMIVRAIALQLKLTCIEPKSEISIENELDFCAMTPMQVEKSLHSILKIKKLIIGGSAISSQLEEKLKNLPNEIFETFGMTETLSHIAMKPLNPQRGLLAAFKILPKIEIRKDERGCLAIKTPYFAEEIITNDIIEFIDNQNFIWKGRIDNVINSGGIKLFPEEIEQKLRPFIKERFYISSQKSQLLGEEVVLIINSKIPVFDENVFVKAKLSKFEKPKQIIFKDKFKETQNGKIIREKM